MLQFDPLATCTRAQAAATNYAFLTQKERDVETALDYFDARYYSSSQGRFTGVDFVDADWTNPQTLNKYQYCLNNPLAKVDRDGRYEEDVHRDLTLALAMAAGFDPAAAAVIAGANQGVDDNPETSPMGTRPWGQDVEVRSLYHSTTFENRGTEKEIYTAVDWRVIAPLVDAFNRARTAEQKRQLIAQIAAKAAEHQAQQLQARKTHAAKKRRNVKSLIDSVFGCDDA